MTYAREQQVPPGEHGVYHCYSRCVRQAFLCGFDTLTRRSYEHRKQWIEDRLLTLTDSFAAAVHAFAIMDNHFHVVVEMNPPITRAWDDQQVATRWLRLFGPERNLPEPSQPAINALCDDPEHLNVLRERLGSLSWLMRALKEHIARRANREDDRKGCFWDCRFNSQKLLDDTACLATMVYVDLNPLRASLATTPENSQHTALAIRATNQTPEQPLHPIAAGFNSHLLDHLTTAEYLNLADWTARTLHPGKPGSLPQHYPPILQRLETSPQHWLRQVPATTTLFRTAIGTASNLSAHATKLGRKWLRGIHFARQDRPPPRIG